MPVYAFSLREIHHDDLASVGGKAANLGELSRLVRVRVPDGFCVTTHAFKKAVESAPMLGGLFEKLASLKGEERVAIPEVAAAIRRVIEQTPIPAEVEASIVASLGRFTASEPFAIRSSATGEDSPTASFAGQQDTFLNIRGKAAVLRHISRCWASLFTDRAVAYRMQQGLSLNGVVMAVVVQKMVQAQASGVLFTADPMTGNRKIASIEAVFGLGDALVAGAVKADGYKVRGDQICETRTIGTPVLSAAHVVELARLGRHIEAHFGQPQDIEWCLRDDAFHIVQSRPVTTLFPIPKADDAGNHLYVSVGHQQMMTDPLKPLGLSLWQMTAARPMPDAGGRMFVDVTKEMSSSTGRQMLLNGVGRADPLTQDALQTVIDRNFIPLEPQSETGPRKGGIYAPLELNDDPAIPASLIARSQAAIEELKRVIQTKTGTDVLDFIAEDVKRLKQGTSDPTSIGAIMAGINAAAWLNEKMLTWLGEKNAADVLAQSAPNNITSAMGLALLDVADVIRAHPQVIASLEQAKDQDFFATLEALEGGREVHDALRAYLATYGMRCVGEIDVTRTRWAEAPSTLVPLLLSNLKNFPAQEAGRKFEQGRQEAEKKEHELLQRLKQLPDGESKAEETRRMISRLRTFVGYREYPKYSIVSRYFIYKQALLAEGRRLMQANVVQALDDIYYLTFQELRAAVHTHEVDYEMINTRKAEHARYQKLTPPRVLTSEGEVITGAYKREDVPADALVGLAVSAGVAEGRARVLSEMADAKLEVGDILVTTFTDPSWTPAFVSIAALVTEVGGLMTHGAVIAREYGLPAVVGVENATSLIKDGQRIRVHGTEGYVEVLSD